MQMRMLRAGRRDPGTLQEQAAELKAEVRALLAEHGVDKYVIKPVRRNYAFELETVPHGEQWVLKVRYSAAKPSLPLGLEGTSLLCSDDPLFSFVCRVHACAVLRIFTSCTSDRRVHAFLP